MLCSLIHRERLLLFSTAICCTKVPEKIFWNENSVSAPKMCGHLRDEGRAISQTHLSLQSTHLPPILLESLLLDLFLKSTAVTAFETVITKASS